MTHLRFKHTVLCGCRASGWIWIKTGAQAALLVHFRQLRTLEHTVAQSYVAVRAQVSLA